MENQPTLKRSLTLFQVVFLGLAWMTPMIFFTSFGISYESSKGMLTVAYLLAFLAIFFTASSYGKMAKAFPVSGSALTYITKVMNPFIGFLVGWVILLDYLFSCIIANLMFGINLHAQFPSVPSYIWIILLDIVLMVINIIGIKTSANISKLFVCIQIAFIALFCILVFHNLLQNDTSVHLAGPFAMGDSITFSTILAGASIICFSFLGFDSITAMAEETINPKKNIPRAIMIIISVAGILYFSTSYFLQLAYPELKFSNPDTAGFYVANLVGGKILGSIFTTVLVFAVFTQGLSSVATVTRLLYVMGRSAQLPKKSFGYLHPKFRTPVFNVVLVSVISLLGLFISLDTCIKFVNFGALTAFMFVNLSVILHYFIKEKRRTLKGIIAYLVSPLIGAGFIFYLLTLLDKDSLLMGLSWLALGLMYSLYLVARKKKRALVKEQENVTVTVE
ncbi:APC family permease [Heyndrickxia coagulans]|uniref:Amino acid permease-associated region n=1 Tax=Heyndrickxia coagulans 36D1 TaxID=345219 RepID=G2TR06_HEYCO|nr:APC family permease [Heyndrickxia coagulans]AEP00082.1 amino acid permease-associated region [Heyndrickxia coagulans 36D1]